MTTYSRAERLSAIQAAGFQNPLTALAVSLAEFGENRDIDAQAQSDYYANGVREASFGPWQINLPTHPDVTQACAMDLACSTAAAKRISEGGTNFNPWSAFTNGSYKVFPDELAGSLGPTPTPSPPSSSASGAGGQSSDPAPAPYNLSSQQTGSAISLTGNGLSYAEIANRIGSTPECVAEIFGAELKTLPAQAGEKIGAAVDNLTKFTDILKPENLWRLGFVILGIGAIWVGGRLYLKPDAASEQP